MFSKMFLVYVLLKYSVCLGNSCPIVEEGKASWFGGKSDKYMSSNITAFGYDISKNDKDHFCAIRYDTKKKNWYKNRNVFIINHLNGRYTTCKIWDYGPAKWTGRSIDLSPATFKFLELKTDDTVRFVVVEDEDEKAN